MRVGQGYDIHRLVLDRPLILGGITIPYDRGLLGHSDADVVTHAIMDALLGSLALGDIGHYFPPTDPQWRGAHSISLLQKVYQLVREQGWELVNLDCSIVAEQPKLKPHILAIRASLAEALGVETDRVSVKARTNEGLDAIGRGEAIATHAVVLVTPRTTQS